MLLPAGITWVLSQVIDDEIGQQIHLLFALELWIPSFESDAEASEGGLDLLRAHYFLLDQLKLQFVLYRGRVLIVLSFSQLGLLLLIPHQLLHRE